MTFLETPASCRAVGLTQGIFLLIFWVIFRNRNHHPTGWKCSTYRSVGREQKRTDCRGCRSSAQRKLRSPHKRINSADMKRLNSENRSQRFGVSHRISLFFISLTLSFSFCFTFGFVSSLCWNWNLTAVMRRRINTRQYEHKTHFYLYYFIKLEWCTNTLFGVIYN